jgi:protocatechuate 3,4-dioxygenase beta subunit
MKTAFIHLAVRAGRIALTCLAVLILAACSSQPTRVNLPVTGLSSTTLPAAAPTASASQPTSQPAATAYPAVAPTAAATQAPAAAATTTAPAPASCVVPASLTPAVTEGPYFKAGSPERANLLDASTPEVTLTLTGYVFTADCQPVAHALLDFWQANAQGQYDNSGYTLRGHQYTDASGRFQLVTVVPGLYPGRTEHIHVKVQAPGGPILTSQLFFPGVTDNSSDGIYNPGLLINVQNSGATTMTASFNFVVRAE